VQHERTLGKDRDARDAATVRRDGTTSVVVVDYRVLARFKQYANAVDFANGYNLGQADAAVRHARGLLRLVFRGR